MVNNKVVLLLSGGIDSTVLLFHLINRDYEVFPLYINYGQTTYEGEIAAINKIIKGLPINKLCKIDIPDVRKIGCGSLVGEYPNDVTSHGQWYKNEFFPNRNLILLSFAATYAYKISASSLAIGVVGNSYKDTSKEFLNQTKKLIESSLGKYSIIAPYANMDRKIVIEEAIQFNVPIESTFSCNSLANRHCMLCTSCFDRENALLLKKKLLNNPMS